MIADQRIEDHVVEQSQDLRRTGARCTAQQIKTLGQIRATFILVLHFGHHAQRLAKVLLMEGVVGALRIDQSIVALNQQKRAIQYLVNFRFRWLELHGLSQCHAKSLR